MYTFSIAGHILNVYKFSVSHFNYFQISILLDDSGNGILYAHYGHAELPYIKT